MSRAVVTGGAGFIGSHLTQRLRRDFEVIVLDDLSTGTQANVAGVAESGNVRLVEGSITDEQLLRQVFAGVEYVFHQAAFARVPRSIEDPLTANEVNIRGTLNVLLAARDCKVRKVVFASSSSVYGDATTLPQREDAIPNPLSPYALTKLTGEYYCKIFRELYSLPTACLRYFNVYGPRQDLRSQYSAVIPTFISRISQNLPPIIYGDGEQSRDFTFVENVVRANILAAESDSQGVYNIGGGCSTSVNQLAATILKLMQKDLSPIHEKPRAGDPRRSMADISRARAFGYEPGWTLEDGIKATIPFYTIS